MVSKLSARSQNDLYEAYGKGTLAGSAESSAAGPPHAAITRHRTANPLLLLPGIPTSDIVTPGYALHRLPMNGHNTRRHQVTLLSSGPVSLNLTVGGLAGISRGWDDWGGINHLWKGEECGG